jgi:hypothetical protein
VPHPADHPLAALYITRSLPSQLHKAKQNGDDAAVAAIEPVLARARRIAARNDHQRPAEVRATQPPVQPLRPPLPAPAEGWAEIVVDNRGRHQRRWR